MLVILAIWFLLFCKIRKEIKMKKILAAILSLIAILSLAACGSKESEQVVEEPVPIETPVKETFDISIDELDANMADCFGDGLLYTSYEDGIYFVFFTVDGLHDAYGSDSYYTLCDKIETLSETILSSFNINNSMVMIDDSDKETVLYAVFNGEDMTDVLS